MDLGTCPASKYTCEPDHSTVPQLVSVYPSLLPKTAMLPFPLTVTIPFSFDLSLMNSGFLHLGE